MCTHTHTHIYIYIYVCVCVCVCVYVCVRPISGHPQRSRNFVRHHRTSGFTAARTELNVSSSLPALVNCTFYTVCVTENAKLYKHLFLEYTFRRAFLQQVVNCVETEFCGAAVKFSLSLSLPLCNCYDDFYSTSCPAAFILTNSENTRLVSMSEYFEIMADWRQSKAPAFSRFCPTAENLNPYCCSLAHLSMGYSVDRIILEISHLMQPTANRVCLVHKHCEQCSVQYHSYEHCSVHCHSYKHCSAKYHSYEHFCTIL